MISVVIPTYNCNQYLAKTLESVLSQDLGPEFMEIEVVDDCSTESPEFLIDEIGKGRVKFYKQPKNVGHVKNFETGIRRAKGDIVHLLHGDDYVLPGFYEEMLKMYQANPEIGACYCRHFFVDEDKLRVKMAERKANKSGEGKTKKKSRFQERLEEMQRQQQEMLKNRKK